MILFSTLWYFVLVVDWEALVHTGQCQSRCGLRQTAVPVGPFSGRGERGGPGNIHLHGTEPARIQICVHYCQSYSQTQTQIEETMNNSRKKG